MIEILNVKQDKQVTNEMKLEFRAVSSNEAFARTAVAAFVTQLNPTLEEISDIKTAVSEAVNAPHCICQRTALHRLSHCIASAIALRCVLDFLGFLEVLDHLAILALLDYLAF